MLVKQISVFVANREGRLAELIGILGEHDIDISALSLADTTDFGILRMIVNKPDEAKAILKENGFTVKISEVIAVAVEDKPGGLASALTILSENGINIEYMYAFVGKSDDGALVIIRVDLPEKAVEVLDKASDDVNVIDAKDVYRL